MASVLRLAVLFVCWMAFSSVTDGLNKTILRKWSFPVSLTMAQFGMSALCGFFTLRIVKLHPYQDGPSRVGFQKVLPATLCQTIGFFLTNVSFGRVAVSFSHTIKASAPIFSMVLSYVLAGQVFSPSVYASIGPIVGGVIVASRSELSFDLYGFLAAAGSNACFTSRSIFSKPIFSKLDNINMYYYISLTAFTILSPVWLFTEGRAFLAEPTLVPDSTLAGQLALCGVFHFLYNQVSFLALNEVVPLTHSVMNVSRRVAVIVTSILYFGNTPSWMSIAGVSLVFIGVACYTYAKSQSSQPAKLTRQQRELKKLS